MDRQTELQTDRHTQDISQVQHSNNSNNNSSSMSTKQFILFSYFFSRRANFCRKQFALSVIFSILNLLFCGHVRSRFRRFLLNLIWQLFQMVPSMKEASAWNICIGIYLFSLKLKHSMLSWLIWFLPQTVKSFSSSACKNWLKKLENYRIIKKKFFLQ